MSDQSDLVPHAPPAVQTPPTGALEGDYLPPGGSTPKARRKANFSPLLLGIAVLFAKFKLLLTLLLGLKWAALVLKVGGSLLGFFLSVWAYSLLYGWPLALVFVVLILLHELGHVAAMRLFGTPSTLPFFVPFFGAFVRPLAPPASLIHESWIALAGPLAGGLAAYGCFVLGNALHSGFWIAGAYLGFFLNLFNLIPILPFDGGRATAAVSPKMQLLGLLGLLVASVAGRFWNPLVLVLALCSLPQAVQAWRGKTDPRLIGAFPDRLALAAAYFTVAGALLAGTLAAHLPLGRSVGD